jgi:oligopeptide/dipeptide ABC transporter ATP-binding protein
METPRRSRLGTIPGCPPDLTAPAAGCPFAPRCAAAADDCGAAPPPASEDGGHRWSCLHPIDSEQPKLVPEAHDEFR